jgi:hypothetical protein
MQELSLHEKYHEVVLHGRKLDCQLSFGQGGAGSASLTSAPYSDQDGCFCKCLPALQF